MPSSQVLVPVSYSCFYYSTPCYLRIFFSTRAVTESVWTYRHQPRICQVTAS